MNKAPRSPRMYAKIFAVVTSALALTSTGYAHGGAENTEATSSAEARSDVLAGAVPLDKDLHLTVEGSNEVAAWEPEAKKEGAHPQTLKIGVELEPHRGVHFGLHSSVQQDDGSFAPGAGTHVSLDF